ncbi:hypothetical protein GYMLUDRAFT_237861 [Collybiopsis luxurians FD-317 M1]|nr:hypothetical protein GYMLUDRAFT_237861 [Collybiopsis luxurians FD-317 M1]
MSLSTQDAAVAAQVADEINFHRCKRELLCEMNSLSLSAEEKALAARSFDEMDHRHREGQLLLKQLENIKWEQVHHEIQAILLENHARTLEARIQALTEMNEDKGKIQESEIARVLEDLNRAYEAKGSLELLVKLYERNILLTQKEAGLRNRLRELKIEWDEIDDQLLDSDDMVVLSQNLERTHLF